MRDFRQILPVLLLALFPGLAQAGALYLYEMSSVSESSYGGVGSASAPAPP